VLDSRGLAYRIGDKVQGQLESHPFNLVVPPNGHPGMALGILPGQNTHTIAQVWGYKCEDIKREKRNRNMKLLLIYDTRFERWSDASKAILENRADAALPSDALANLRNTLELQGIVTRGK
jgi:hypothetical protein